MNFGIDHIEIFVLKIIYSFIIFLSNPINLFPVYSIIYEIKLVKKCIEKIQKKKIEKKELNSQGEHVTSVEELSTPKKKIGKTSMEEMFNNENLEKINMDIEKKNKIKKYFFKFLIRFLVLLLSFLIAVISPDFVKFISFIGSFIFASLGFVFPVRLDSIFNF
jgi:amino acid permease